MRTSRPAFLVVAALLIAAPTLSAQQPAQSAPKTMTAEEFDARVKAELDKIRARLKLTPEQQTQLKALLTEEVDRMDALAYRYEGEARTVLTDSRAKMRNVLTPKQQTEWDKIKVEYREQIRAKAEAKPASSKS